MKRRSQRIIASMLVATLAASTPMTFMVSAEATNVPAVTANETAEELDTVYVGLIKEGEREGNFNKDWSFYYVDGAEPQGVQAKDYNDTNWRKLNLPHDYSIEQDYTVTGEAESGFLLGGVGWYRKHFTVPESYKDKDITINFDGVYMNSDIYVNGKKVATHNSGYTAFAVELSDYLVCDGKTDNVIAVRVNNPIPTSRWYSGSGIYRNVTLSITDQVHVGYEGTYVTTPKLETQKTSNTDVLIKVDVENETKASTTATVRNTVMYKGEAKSTPVTKEVTVAPGAKGTVETTAVVNAPKLWSVDTPEIYQIKTEVLVGGKVVDTYETDFGFRHFKFNKDTGFSLNGKNLKLKGVCMHHDQGSLGSVANDRAIERQMEILKEMGCNSVRVTHNPASEALIKACDKLGLLVINEAFDGWSASKNGNHNDFGKYFSKKLGQGNLLEGANPDMTWGEFAAKSMVKTSKNAPSIFMWSLGNEIYEGANGDTSQYPQLAGNIIDWIEEIDDSRYVTIGDNKTKQGHTGAISVANKLVERGGIWGFNYPGKRGEKYPEFRKKYPSWTMYGSETASTHKTRGVYNTKQWNGNTNEATAYDKYGAGWGDLSGDSWYGNVKYDYVAGEYVWTGFDYIGEPTPKNGVGTGSQTGGQPVPKSSYFGIVDTAGFEKDAYYLYQSMWNDKVNTLHILPTWDEKDVVKDASGNVEVEVYTDAAKVELYLNDKLIETKQMYEKTTDAGHTYRTTQADGNGKMFLTFNVPYKAGTLTAKAYDKAGKLITNTEGRNTVKTTAGAPKLNVTADRTKIKADGEDLSYITIDITDANGNIVNSAKNMLNYKLTGNGKIVGMDNGDPTDTKSFKPDSPISGSRKAMAGKALVIVQSTDAAGSFTLTVSGDGVETKSVTVNTEKEASTGNATLGSYKINRDMYVKLNETPKLPATVQGTFTDGTVKTINVKWDEVTAEQLSKPGILAVKGTLGDTGYFANVNIHVVGDIKGFENYSTYTHAELMPKLPETLMGYYGNGDKAEAFPVVWEKVTEEQIAKTGNTQVNGTVTALGKTYSVKAGIRIVEKLPVPVNIASKTYNNKPTLTESSKSPSDNLQSLNDGVTNPRNDTTTRWTNWNVKGTTKESYIQYDWNQKYKVGRVDMWIYTDANVPIPENIEIQYKAEDGTYKTAKTSNITMVSYNDGVTPFGIETPVPTDSIRVLLTSPALGTAVGLTEVEVYEALPDVPVSNKAELESITIDGKALTGFDAATKTYNVEGKLPTTVTAVGKENAAVTVLPIFKNQCKIIVTSEDHSQTATYTLNYNSTGEPVEVNKEELVTAINNAKAKEAEKDSFTEKSYKALENALKAGETVNNNAEANQTEVDNAVKAIQDAIQKLEKKTGKTGWVVENNIWYLYDAKGVKLTGWQQEGGAWYYLNASGAMQNGWVQLHGVWYYLNKSGAMQTGWMNLGGAWYYLDHASGAMQTGWAVDGATWYYLNPASGVMQTGWLLENNTWYYLSDFGAMETGWIIAGGQWYLLNPSGAMQTGWQLAGGKWYLLGANGVMQTGWQLVDGVWYFLNPDGSMATGLITWGQKRYYLGTSGAWNGVSENI